MKVLKLILMISLLGYGNVFGQKTSVVGNIVLRIKTYEQGIRENEIGFAADATLEIRNLVTGDTVTMESKYGIFRTNLAIGQNYMVKVSKPGFVSKSIMVTTTGAVSRYKYLLRFDFYLQPYGLAAYSHQKPVMCIVHNRFHFRFDLTDCRDKARTAPVKTM